MAIAGLGPPTAQLPPVGKIKSSSIIDLEAAIQYLTLLYNPEIHGSRVIERRLCPLHAGARPRSPYSPRRRLKPLQIQTEVTLTSIRADTFERTYAVRWLTTLVSQAAFLTEDSEEMEAVVQDAASLLAICAGAASAGTRSRTFVFASHSLTDLTSIKVHITDLPLNNQDYSSVGAQTWGGACLLAEMIIQSPPDFCLSTSNIISPRMLELGSGTGLVGLTVAKLLSLFDVSANVVTTDYHPAVLENLSKNIADNFASSTCSVSISSGFLDWTNPPDSSTAPFDEPFDVIFGADTVYEIEHAAWIKTCVERFLRKPSHSSLQVLSPSDPPPTTFTTHPRFHLVIPFRSTHTAEAESVEKAFPFAPSIRAGWSSPPDGASPEDAYTLAITSKEIIICEDTVWANNRQEVEYIHYVISWV
ncbi:putative methyltransferase-domain-containing protein [Irpex rosettiformis]|uniref:Methyltransferase-domain-containing protein n=1 Tax=Irpex rosettiformis TaxID=378272 RepID=A0ACB8U677_9APHY|nr:putative methyltransferase-domain-containing protein [Irpex rosettiformis]